MARPLHGALGGIGKGDWANRVRLLREDQFVLSHFAIGLDAGYGSVVRYGGNRLSLIRGSVFDLVEQAARDADGIRAILDKEDLLETLLLREHDDGVGLRTLRLRHDARVTAFSPSTVPLPTPPAASKPRACARPRRRRRKVHMVDRITRIEP